MFRFAHIELLYLLALIPVLAIIFALMMRRRRLLMERFGNLELLKELIPSYSRTRLRLKLWIWLTAYACLVIAAARPQLGSKLREEKAKGVEMMQVLVSISRSSWAMLIR